jgi:hypothetical protein
MDHGGAVRLYDGNWSRIGLEDGLIQRNIKDIYFAEDGSVWFATSGGITRFK